MFPIEIWGLIANSGDGSVYALVICLCKATHWIPEDYTSLKSMARTIGKWRLDDNPYGQDFDNPTVSMPPGNEDALSGLKNRNTNSWREQMRTSFYGYGNGINHISQHLASRHGYVEWLTPDGDFNDSRCYYGEKISTPPTRIFADGSMEWHTYRHFDVGGSCIYADGTVVSYDYSGFVDKVVHGGKYCCASVDDPYAGCMCAGFL